MDLFGFVEFSPASNLWCAAVDIGDMILKDHDLNGCFFGVDNVGNFEPLFANRGLPSDVSDCVRERIGNLKYVSWFDCAELAQVDWTVRASARDSRISQYRLIGEKWCFETKWISSEKFGKIQQALTEDGSAVITSGDLQFCRRFLARAEGFNGTGMVLVAKLMNVLSEQYGKTNTRVIVGFD